MIFRSITISRFCRFRDTVTIANLDDGLNVIAGDNEEGKSTVLKAIRAALFERYKSSVGDSFRPYGHKVNPTVQLVFDHAGKSWTLNKTFSKLKAGDCTLDCSDGNRWQGPEAEDHLRSLLEFEYGHGHSKPEIQGLPGLLWVEQGSAFERISIADGPRSKLQSVFGDEMSEMLGGDHGDAVYKRITAQREEFFSKLDKPRGDYKKLIKQVDREQDLLEAKQAELRDYDDKVERLSRYEKRMLELQQDNALQTARSRLDQAREDYKAIEDLIRSQESASARVTQAKSDEALVVQNWQTRQQLMADAKATDKLLATRQQALVLCTAELENKQASPRAARERIALLQQEHLVLEAAIAAIRASQELDQAMEKSRELNRQQQEAHRVRDELQRVGQALQAITITPADVDRLDQLDRDIQVKSQTLSAAATRVDFELAPSVNLRCGEEMLKATGHLELAHTTELEIEGVVRLSIQPGGSDLPNLEQTLQILREDFSRLLEKLDVADVATAQRQLRRYKDLRQREMQQQEVLKVRAPIGLASLEEAAAQAAQSAHQLQARLAEGETRSGNIEELEHKRVHVRDEMATLQTELRDQHAELTSLREQVVKCQANMVSAKGQQQDRVKALVAARSMESDDDIARRLAELKDALSLAKGQLQGIQSKLEALAADAAQAEVQRAEQVFIQLQKEQAQLKQKIRDLRTELNTLGQVGVAEQCAEAQVNLQDRMRQLDQQHAQAGALDLLYQTMTRALEDAKQAVAIPIVQKMQPYLRQLLPDAEPAINQDLELTGITRDGDEEAFENLSIGTREQLAILVRLAYADLLAENGIAATVILDDALVNSDDSRRERMKAILFQAARHYQIIVLTCHGREYRDAGGRFIELSD